MLALFAEELDRSLTSPVVLTLPRELLVGNRHRLKQHVVDAIADGHRHFVLDLSACGYIDSASLGTLVSISSVVRRAHGKVALANVHDDLLALFALTHLDDLFAIESSIAQAIAKVST